MTNVMKYNPMVSDDYIIPDEREEYMQSRKKADKDNDE
jgi:hypothetical protein